MDVLRGHQLRSGTKEPWWIFGGAGPVVRLRNSVTGVWGRLFGVGLLMIGISIMGIGFSAPAGATACSTSTGNASCTINTTITVTAGTLTLESSPSLYWTVDLNGYDQWESGSSAALTGCSASSSGTTCSSGTAPVLLPIDGTGSGSGWAISEYLTTSDLPTGAKLHFDGAGSATIGHSQVSPIGTDPFAATTPANVCDYASSCTVATAATTCSHSAIGFTTCPSYPVDMTTGTSSTAQADLYSATAATGEGAICFGSGTATATGCTGVTPSDYYNLGVKSNTTAGSLATTVINMTITSGP